MKKIIIILFTVILGVYMGSKLILGSGGSSNSLKAGADTIITKTVSEIDNIDTSLSK